MNLLLGIKDWFAQNWMLLVLVAVLAFFVVTTFLKQKKEINARNELSNSIVRGTKIVTTAGVYGVVESIEETTDGKVVTINTGNEKHPSTMTIHINAIMGIDNKTTVVDSSVGVIDEYDEEDIEVEEKPKKSTKKKSDE